MPLEQVSQLMMDARKLHQQSEINPRSIRGWQKLQEAINSLKQVITRHSMAAVCDRLRPPVLRAAACSHAYACSRVQPQVTPPRR